MTYDIAQKRLQGKDIFVSITNYLYPGQRVYDTNYAYLMGSFSYKRTGKAYQVEDQYWRLAFTRASNNKDGNGNSKVILMRNNDPRVTEIFDRDPCAAKMIAGAEWAIAAFANQTASVWEQFVAYERGPARESIRDYIHKGKFKFVAQAVLWYNSYYYEDDHSRIKPKPVLVPKPVVVDPATVQYVIDLIKSCYDDGDEELTGYEIIRMLKSMLP